MIYNGTISMSKPIKVDYCRWVIELVPPQDVSEVDRIRLAGLAQAFSGSSNMENGGYLFKPDRARKCRLLYSVGARYTPTPRQHFFRFPDGTMLDMAKSCRLAAQRINP